MKILLTVLALLASMSTQAGFIKSDYLFGLSQRHQDMVSHDGEYYLDLDYENHGKWVTTSHILVDHQVIGFYGMDLFDLQEDNRWEDVSDKLFYDEPYFCNNIVQDWSLTYDMEDCQLAVQEMLGDALNEADAVKLVIMHGDYYGDWEKVLVILSDYKTKETVTLAFDIIHEI